MDTRQFVETRTRRYMAQALEEFETQIEQPLSRGESVASDSIERVKRTFRRKLQALGSDCIDLMPNTLEINGYEPVVRR